MLNNDHFKDLSNRLRIMKSSYTQHCNRGKVKEKKMNCKNTFNYDTKIACN